MDRVAVVGLGLIGGSIAKRLLREGPAGGVVGYDSDARVRDAATAGGLDVAGSLEQAARAADLLVVAVPPPATADCVIAALEAEPHVLVSDVASVKRPIVERVAAQLGSRRNVPAATVDRFLPGHPLAGAEAGGWAAARADLLDGGTWAICPQHANAAADALAAFGPLFDALDARIVVCAPGAHDRAVACTSHAAHVVAQVLAATVAGPEAGLTAALSGPAFRDMTRVARSDARLWGQVLAMNDEAVTQALAQWGERLRRLAREGSGTTGQTERGLSAGGGAAAETEGGESEPWATVWDEGARARALVDRLRWSHVSEWWPASTTLPPWERLIALGERGVTLRRLRVQADELTFEQDAAT